MSRRKLKILSLAERAEVINQLERNVTQASVARRFGVGQAVIARIKKEKESILDWVSNKNQDRKRKRNCEAIDVDEALSRWFKEEDRTGLLYVSIPILKEKANQLARELGFPNFKASSGWIDRWKERNNIKIQTRRNKNVQSHLQPIGMDLLKQIACAAIDEEQDHLFNLSQEIWNHKELAFEEHQSHATLTQFLEDKGFTVQRHYKLETAFLAQWECPKSSISHDVAVPSRKPHIAILCEYDALPDIGHACGHNLISELGVAAALGVKTAMEQEDDLGKLSVIGTPAEEGGGGKIDMINAGVFDDVDVVMMAHPAPFTDARPVFIGGKKFFANYHGKPSHAAGFPWEGVNALDAAVLGYVNIAALRQQLHPSWRVHAIITKGGTKTNIIPDETEMMVQVRAPQDSEIHQAENKVKACLRASAEATGCTVDFTDFPKPYSSLVTNETLARLYETNGTLIGLQFPPVTTKKVLGSTDMGNLSHKVPSLHPTYQCGTEAFNHTREFNTAAGSPEAQPSTISQGKVLAMVALDIFMKPELLDSIKQDFKNDKKNF